MVQVGEHFEEIKLPARAVNGLKGLNSDGKRESTSKDKMFIKALLVGLSSVKGIKNGEINKRLIRFMKGKLFKLCSINQ